MKFFSFLFIFTLFFVGFTYSAPAITDVCVPPDVFKNELFIILKEDLGEKFTEDFDEAYRLILVLAQFDNDACYTYMDGAFLCSSVQSLYNKRIPKASEAIWKDCYNIINKFYPATF